jgi:LPXTG-motif cell wall-anchored protein
MRAGAWPELALAGISVISALAGLFLRYRRRAPDEPGDADRAGPGTATVEPAGAEPAHEHS